MAFSFSFSRLRFSEARERCWASRSKLVIEIFWRGLAFSTTLICGRATLTPPGPRLRPSSSSTICLVTIGRAARVGFSSVTSAVAPGIPRRGPGISSSRGRPASRGMYEFPPLGRPAGRWNPGRGGAVPRSRCSDGPASARRGVVLGAVDGGAATCGAASCTRRASSDFGSGSGPRATGWKITGSAAVGWVEVLARAAASARRARSRSSFERTRARPPERVSVAESTASSCGPRVAWLAAIGFSATSGAGGATSGSASLPGPPSLRDFFFSTTTDFDRPWLKFCRTWPDSTVRCSDSGFRPPALRVLSVWSLESVMRLSVQPSVRGRS